MNTFLYEATDSSGKIALGKLEGNDEEEIRRKLLSQKLQPITVALASPPVSSLDFTQTFASQAGFSATANALARRSENGTSAPLSVPQKSSITPVEGNAGGKVVLAGNAARMTNRSEALGRPASTIPAAQSAESDLGGVPARDMMHFFRQFSTLVQSGISIFGAVEDLANRTPNQNLAHTAKEMADASRHGGRISDVMAGYPRIFPVHITATVRAGELGGFMEIVLSEIAQNYEQQIALYKGAWVPKALAVQAYFTLFMVQPLFSSLFHSMNFAANMKLYLELTFLRNMPIAVGLLLLLKWGSKLVQEPKYRSRLDALALKLPPYGDLQRQFGLASFLRMLRRLYHAGVPPIQAWEGAMNAASNSAIRERLQSAYGLMQQGASLPDAFAATGLFADHIENLIITGQQAGQVVEMLDRSTDYYQEQVEKSAGKSRRAMLELGILALLVFGGAALCWMTYAYFHGIFSFVDNNFSS